MGQPLPSAAANGNRKLLLGNPISGRPKPGNMVDECNRMFTGDLLLDQTYEFDGLWWHTDDERRQFGRLKLSPRKLDLNLYGDADALSSFLDYHNKLTTIYGRTLDGTPITITSFARGTATEYHMGGSTERTAKCHFHVNRCVIGD